MRNYSFLCHVTPSDGDKFQGYGGLDTAKWDRKKDHAFYAHIQYVCKYIIISL